MEDDHFVAEVVMTFIPRRLTILQYCNIVDQYNPWSK